MICEKAKNDELLDNLFENWSKLMADIGISDCDFIAYWFDKIKRYYCEPWRYYHTLNHINYLLSLYHETKIKFKDINANVIELCIWFHDIIYIPPNHDNEKVYYCLCFCEL